MRLKPEPTGIGEDIKKEIERFKGEIFKGVAFDPDALKVEFSLSLKTVANRFKEYAKTKLLDAYTKGADKAKSKTPDDARIVFVPNLAEIKARITQTYNEYYATIKKVYSDSFKLLAKEHKDANRQKTPVYDLRYEVQGKLVDKGFLHVTYDNGASVPVDVYAEMVANTASIETFNTGAIEYAAEASDLVQMTTIFPTCNICAKYQGRVYSVSGNDKRYPALYETVLSKGFNTVHPNCRHEFIPFYEMFQTKDELEAIRKKSNAEFVDNRTNNNRADYKRWQEVNAAARERKNKKLYGE